MKPTKRLPLHSWEAHPLADKGEIRKPYLIMVITLVAVVVLVLLLFAGKQFVGKAITIPEGVPIGQGGIFLAGDELVTNEFTVPIVLSLGSDQQSVAVSFNLMYNNLTANCNNTYDIMDDKFNYGVEEDLHVVRKIDCNTSSISFEYAGLCADEGCSNAISGTEVTIAEIKFTASHPMTSSEFETVFSFTDFNIYGLDGSGLITAGTVDTNVMILAAPGCGNGIANEREECDDSNTVDGDGCSSVCLIEAVVDTDGDSIADMEDNCPNVANLFQRDRDRDGIGDDCDNCPNVANFEQEDTDSDGVGDACEMEGAGCIFDSDCDSVTNNFCSVDEKACESVTNYECSDDSVCVVSNVVAGSCQTCPAGCTDGTCDEIACINDTGCPELYVCTNDVCVEEEAEPEISPIQIQLLNQAGTLVTGNVTKSSTYTIQTTITPTVNLSANHLVIVSVSVGSLTKSIYWTKMPQLAGNVSETVRFTYQLPSTTTGNLTVKAFVWNDWLGAALYSQLVAPEEVSYGISS